MNQKVEDLNVDDELKDMDEKELLERLNEVSEERTELENSLEEYQEDIEEGNFDGDSIEITVNIGECNSEINEILQVMIAKDYKIPEDYKNYVNEL